MSLARDAKSQPGQFTILFSMPFNQVSHATRPITRQYGTNCVQCERPSFSDIERQIDMLATHQPVGLQIKRQSAEVHPRLGQIQRPHEKHGGETVWVSAMTMNASERETLEQVYKV